ncbi:MAG: SH3 domain-containing protein [Anaerolineae bacterium]|nr:SH3 domain-containing protein [Anaerolineae bacterium]
MKQLLVLLALVLLGGMLTLSTGASYAQTNTSTPVPTFVATSFGNPPPDVFQDALNDLGRRLGRTITLDSFNNTTSKWTWDPVTWTNTNLDCPEAGLPSSAVSTPGYQFLLTLNGVDYEYRASVADRSSLILCSSENASVNPGRISSGTGAAGAATAPPSAPGVCPTNLPGRLVVGKQGRVTPGLANRLRADASYTSAVIGRIPAGGVFDVLAGPKCDGSSNFWQVTYAGVTGWTSEGYNGEYWLEPIS